MKNINVTKSKQVYIAISVFAILLTIILGVVIFQSQPNKTNTSKSEHTVSVSFYPLYYFTKRIVGDRMNVKNITPSGSEPHEYEPTANQISEINKSKLFIYNGADLDPWAEKLQVDLSSKGVKTLEFSKNIELLNPIVEAKNGEEEEKYEKDPHIWLSPTIVKQQVQSIRDSLISIDPSNKDFYTNNTTQFTNDLNNLQREFRDGLASCEKNEIITSHNFLQYLARDYGFSSTPISGISPESEPSSQDLATIAQLVKEKDIRFIFTETLSSPKLAETIANETGAGLLSLNPLEGLTDDEIREGKDYISVQKENLANLTKALECR